jgi:hypothetical protein
MTGALSLIKTMAVMALSLASEDVTDLKLDFVRWAKEASDFVKPYGFQKAFDKEVKNFLKSGMEFTEEDGLIFNGILKDKLPKLLADTTITQEQLSMIKDLNLYFKKDSAPAWKRITNNISMTRDNKLIKFFIDEEEIPKGDTSTAKKMAQIVELLTKRKNDPILTLNEIREFREDQPKVIEKYSALRKVFVANYKKALLSFIRNSGKQTVDVKIATKYLDAIGCNNIPKGFVGSIDEKGSLYTVKGKQIFGGLVGEVVMNPKYDPEKDNTYVCSLKTNPTQRLRTVSFLQGNRAAKFDKVSKFIDTIDSHRKSWISDLSAVDGKTQLLAEIVEIIYETQARIGGEGNKTDDQDTYGISTLLVKHVKIKEGKVQIDYPGKKGTAQHHVIKSDGPVSKKVVKILEQQIKGKKPNDRVFTYMGRPIKAAEVNGYVKSLGVNVSVHKFRHVKGTKVMMELLKKNPFKKGKVSQSQAEKWIKQEATEVGKILHHRSGVGEKEKVVGSTALAAYVDPSVVKGFFTDLGLRIPKWLPKTGD